MESVLVLNANFEPIHVCNIYRAIGLILSERASLVVNGRGYIYTVNAAYPRPSIIRLQHMVRRPRLRVKLTRREVFRRDSYTCQYCGKHGLDMTFDHVIPRHLGGQHVWTNVVTACPACNHHKGGRTPSEANMRLLRLAVEPPASAVYLFNRHLAENNDWEPFLRAW